MNRTHAAAHSFLLNDQFQGVVIADCWSGYTTLETKTGGSIRHASCHAHARRKFVEAMDSRKELAEKILGIYQILYDLEDEIRHASAEIRAAKRSGPMREVWNRLKEELRSGPYQKLLPQEPLQNAVEYIFNNEANFEICFSNQAVPLDNNACERAMKHVALARKNWLFLGSARAGIETAGLMTLVHSAIRNDLDYQAYIQNVLQRLLAGDRDLESMHPDRWRETHPEAVREYREVERRDRAERREMIRAEKREARRRKFRQ